MYNDSTVKFDYNPVTNKFELMRDIVGVDAGEMLEVATYTYTDANTMHVSDTIGNDTTGTGTAANPFKTILKGINSCTSAKNRVVVLDSYIYEEDISGYSNAYFSGLFAATGQTPKLQRRLLGYTPTDANSIFVKKTGLDTNAGTQAAPKLTLTGTIGAISAVDATHQKIVIMDSGIYDEFTVEFTGNFQGLYAIKGHAPTLNFTYDKDYKGNNELVAPTTFSGVNDTAWNSVAVLQNGNWVCCYQDISVNDLKFVIYSQLGVQIKAPTIIDTGGRPSVAVLQNGNWVCCYTDNAGFGEFVIYSETGVQIKAPTVFSENVGEVVRYNSVAVLQNGNWVNCYEHDSPFQDRGKFVIYTQAGVQVVAPTQFSGNNTVKYVSVAVLQNGNWVCCYTNGIVGVGKFVIHNQAGTQLVVPTTFSSAENSKYNSVAVLQNGNWVCCYQGSISGGQFVIYSQSGIQIIAPTIFNSGAIHISVAILDNSNWICCFQSGTDGVMQIYTESGIASIPATIFETDIVEYNSVAVLQNGNWVCCYRNTTTNLGEFVIWLSYSSGVNISVVSEINGIILDAEKQCNINKIIKIDSAKLTLKWSDVKNTVNNITSFIPYGIHGNNEIDVYNNKIVDNGSGICLTTNKAQIHNNLIYWNSAAAGIQITGAAAVSGDITIEHNTIFDNERGIKLIANNGTNEILKNDIFHDNDVYAIDAAVAVVYSYSVNTDPVNNATAGSSVLLMNPLFKNEGAAVAADIDLMLKNTIIGYPATSPAYLLADDSRDAGAYNVSYIGSITSWTSFTMEKPIEIPVSYPPVGAVKTINRDGSISTSKSGFSKLMTFPWDGVRNADFANLLLMGTCDESLVRIYIDPVTFPNAYELFYLIYSTIGGSPKAFRLTRTGVDGVKFRFGRKYE